MSVLSDLNTEIRRLISVANAGEADFVGPVHKIAPVRLMVFEELTIEFKVLTNLEDDVLLFNISVPFA